MSLEVPNEIWSVILKQVGEVRDWGHLQQVSHAFHAIVRAECWTQLKELKLRIDYSGDYLEVNGQGWLGLSEPKLPLLVQQLAMKAIKLQTVSLDISEETLLPEDIYCKVLQYLASASLQVKQLDLQMDFYESISVVFPLSDFITSISTTLESLSIFIGEMNSPELCQALWNCRALRIIHINVSDPSIMESLLCKKTQLQMVQIDGWFEPPFRVTSALLNTGAHLTSCHFEQEGNPVLEAYMQVVQEQNLMSDHPLKTLKTLTLDSPGAQPAFQLFPALEELNLLQLEFDIGILNLLVGQFLGQYRDAPGNRRFLNIEMSEWTHHLPSLSRILEQIVCPVASAEQKLWNRELSFVRGNAIAKACIMGNWFRLTT